MILVVILSTNMSDLSKIDVSTLLDTGNRKVKTTKDVERVVREYVTNRLQIQENLAFYYDKHGRSDGVAQNLSILHDGELVYQEKGNKPSVYVE